MILEGANIVHEVGDVVGMVVSVPLVIGIIQLVRFASGIENSIKNTAERLGEYMTASERRMSHVETVTTEHNGKIAVLWDGHERRKNNRGVESE